MFKKKKNLKNIVCASFSVHGTGSRLNGDDAIQSNVLFASLTGSMEKHNAKGSFSMLHLLFEDMLKWC